VGSSNLRQKQFVNRHVKNTSSKGDGSHRSQTQLSYTTMRNISSPFTDASVSSPSQMS